MKIFNNSKLCTQILCFLFLMMLLNLGILLGCLNINLYFFKEMILDSSLSILNRQLNQEIKTFSFFSKLMIERYQFREIKRIESINRLYQFTWDIQINLMDSEQCLNKKYSSISGRCSMCYGIMNSKVNLNETNFSKYIKITNLFSFTFFMADNNFDLVFAGTTKEKFIAVWPQQGIVTFDPQTRPWFLQGQNQVNNNTQLYQTYFTKPFIHAAFKSITISHTQSLYDKDFSRIGVATIQLNFSSTFPQFLQNNQRIKGYILDQNYNILQGNVQYNSINTFFDQNITGFNQSNLIILQTYLNQGQILQNCQKLNDKLLCLQDIFQQEFIIEAYKLRENNQYFILVLNPHDDLQLLEKRTDTLNQQIAQLMQTIFLQTLIPYFSASILMLIVIFHITNKISKIIQKAKLVIFKNSASGFKLFSLQVFQVEKHNSLNCLEKLEITFAQLNNKLNLHQKQNCQCLQISNLCEYIQRDFYHQLSLKKSIHQLQNQDYCLPSYQIKKIINHQKYNYFNLP